MQTFLLIVDTSNVIGNIDLLFYYDNNPILMFHIALTYKLTINLKVFTSI